MSALDALQILGAVKDYAESIKRFPEAIEKSKHVMDTLEIGLKETASVKEY